MASSDMDTEAGTGMEAAGGAGGDFQDFAPVVIRKKKTGKSGYPPVHPGTPKKTGSTVSASAGAGTAIASTASSTYIPGHISAGKKLSEHDDLLIPKQYLSTESRTELVRARTGRGMTQVALNNALSFPANMINAIEAGKLCPTPKQLDILNRYLGTKLHYGGR